MSRISAGGQPNVVGGGGRDVAACGPAIKTLVFETANSHVTCRALDFLSTLVFSADYLTDRPGQLNRNLRPLWIPPALVKRGHSRACSKSSLWTPVSEQQSIF